MRTIKVMRPDQQFNKANETLSVYAPLANRLGMWKIKNELEAISLEIVHHKAYHAIQEQLQEIQEAQEPLSEQITDQIYGSLLFSGIDIRKVSAEPHNIYSVFTDLQARGASHNSVDVPLRLEILVGDDMTCYMALGQLHQLWKPVPGKLDDYIANPRDNLYRSLHTTVVHTSGQHIKLRIRTEAMDKVSEVGVLAKWLYAGTPLWSKGIAERMDAFFESIRAQIHVDSQNLSESVRAVVEDVFGTQIQVYTPQGDMRNLVTGATAVDFAYAIHTGLGNQCQAAYVNNELYPLNKPLQNGDRVRIEKREWTQPHRAWLDEDLGYIVTNYARNHIRRWFRRLPDDLAIHQGK
jgi:(p)ppGpp synthase/HD superfamily hydrolase